MKQVRWRKSSFSGGNNGQCVELAHTLTVVRDSKNPTGPTLVGRIDALVAAVKNGTLGH
ncbi:DUF397 domain-containing protein [Actinokineospora globicatena]|uniref:DUF397 domain-containing protein n=1 Tax=Actinokineospora globicatena TaxID=103729 RepID=UPI0020A295D6|nr:DUF397 domain-containing protein [Actinokineospora globicatena]MCP2306584.1 protein of unknown function (DUF397) [Actinokineospora globicatena]GLW82017.1 hypothetical protein Aglo01_64980 [Actinokineospora globicatena]GLW88811.1 hypothetical protein Aglo02_64500 [Actinokineospora globicatena]